MATPRISNGTSNGASGRRIVVIGAGIVGAATALVLQRQGAGTVTLVDKGAPGMECSYGNGGAISPDFCVPASLPGMLRRVPRWFADPLGPLVVRWVGCLRQRRGSCAGFAPDAWTG